MQRLHLNMRAWALTSSGPLGPAGGGAAFFIRTSAFEHDKQSAPANDDGLKSPRNGGSCVNTYVNSMLLLSLSLLPIYLTL